MCTCVRETDRVSVYLDREVDEGLKGQCKSLAFSLNDAAGIYTEMDTHTHTHTHTHTANSSVEEINTEQQWEVKDYI